MPCAPSCRGDRGEIAAIDDEVLPTSSARARRGRSVREKLAVDHRNGRRRALGRDGGAIFSEAEIIELVAHPTLYIGFGRFNEIVGLRSRVTSRRRGR